MIGTPSSQLERCQARTDRKERDNLKFRELVMRRSVAMPEVQQLSLAPVPSVRYKVL